MSQLHLRNVDQCLVSQFSAIPRLSRHSAAFPYIVRCCKIPSAKLIKRAISFRMQFIFLYYDQNRNGRLEVEEAV